MRVGGKRNGKRRDKRSDERGNPPGNLTGHVNQAPYERGFGSCNKITVSHLSAAENAPGSPRLISNRPMRKKEERARERERERERGRERFRDNNFASG